MFRFRYVLRMKNIIPKLTKKSEEEFHPNSTTKESTKNKEENS